MSPRECGYLGLFVILFSLLGLKPVRANPDVMAFVDGVSVSISTIETEIASLACTAFTGGNNFVIAVVQFSSTGSANIAADKLYLGRTSPTYAPLTSNFYQILIESTRYNNWYVLMGFDSSGSSSPTYKVRASASVAGTVYAEAKILAINGSPVRVRIPVVNKQ